MFFLLDSLSPKELHKSKKIDLINRVICIKYNCHNKEKMFFAYLGMYVFAALQILHSWVCCVNTVHPDQSPLFLAVFGMNVLDWDFYRAKKSCFGNRHFNRKWVCVTFCTLLTHLPFFSARLLCWPQNYLVIAKFRCTIKGLYTWLINLCIMWTLTNWVNSSKVVLRSI